MSQSNKLLTGIFSFLPLAAFLAYMINFLSFFFHMIPRVDHGQAAEDLLFPEVFNIVLFAILLGIVSLGVMVYFIIHVVNNKVIDSTEKLVWILIFVFTGMVGFPIYWYMRIYRDQPL